MITNNRKISQTSKMTIFRVLRQICYTKLFKKYSSGNFSYHKILANNLVFNDSCRIVARFKDYLILDDNTEFLRRFYNNDESHPRLNRILNFYETYSKIFPNYMILKESKYLYRNIRKKQKMIDAVNEIKREEEENRKKIKQNIDKNNNNKNELFTKKVKEEIKTFQENTTFQQYKNNFDSDNDDNNENSISISIINKKMFENMENKFESRKEIEEGRNNSILESFVTNETNHSISGILNVLNDNKIYIKDLPKLLEINNYSKKPPKKKANKASNKEKNNKETNNDNINNLQKYKNKPLKQYDNFTIQYQLNKNTYSNASNAINNINGNYITTKGELKKISMLSTSPTILASNTEKNMNEINHYQNIIIPKGNTVININNNYFEQTSSPSLLQMGYYSNKNFHINKNIKANILKKSTTNNNNKKNNTLQMSEKKNNQQQKDIKTPNNEDKFISPKNINKNHIYKNKHNKQISQDYIYQKVNNTNEAKNKKEKMIKINSLSPTPMVGRFDSKFKKNWMDQNYLTEINNPNLITANTRTKENDNGDSERNRLILYFRDVMGNKTKNNLESKDNIEGNNLYSNEINKINNKNPNNENKLNFSNFARYRTITNFKSENKDYSNLLKNENKNILREKCFSKKDILNPMEQLSKDENKSDSKNKKEKITKKNRYKKLQIKDKKEKMKVLIKNNKLNNNYNTANNTNSKADKNNFFKTNNNFKNNKNLFDNNVNKENSSMKSMEKQIKKNHKMLSLNNQVLKTENELTNNITEKGNMILSQSLLNKNITNSKLSNLLMTQKKENQSTTENNNASLKIYHKSKIKNMKYRRDNLNINSEIKYNDINNMCYSNINNFYTENNNQNNKIILTDNSTMNKNINSNEINKFNCSDIRNKYKNFLLKKNKIKSCVFENESSIQNKINKELVGKKAFLNQNQKSVNNYYQNFMDNKPTFSIDSYRTDNIGSLDNLNQVSNSREQNSNHGVGLKTPSIANKKIGLYKKVINKKTKLVRSEKKDDDKKTKKFIIPETIKVNRSKFLENVKNKIYDNHYKTRTKK